MRFLFLIQILFCSFSELVYSGEPDELSISQSSEWHGLIYFSKSKGLLFKDVVNDKSFYLTKVNGFTPLMELKETIKFLKSKNVTSASPHPHCLYPARKKYLEAVGYQFKESINCKGLKQWLSLLKLDEIQIVYASQFLGNPASVMGHTFIKFVDHTNPDYANTTMGYAASVDKDVSAFNYAYKGLFGGFKGVFSEAPYYEKVHEYNNIERRDMWEYTLNLNTEEKLNFALRLWELKYNSHFKYFFFDQNCSYLALAVLDGIFNQNNMLDDLSFYVAPHETVKTLKKYNLIKSSNYRPSIRSKLRSRFIALDKNDRQIVISAINQGKINGDERVELLDILIDYIFLQRYLSDGILSKELESFESDLLLARSNFSKNIKVTTNHLVNPVLSEGTFHVELGSYISSKTISGMEFKFRPGIHGYMDKDISYLRNSSFSFLELNMIYDGTSVFFSEFNLLKIINNNSSIIIDKTFSWGIDISFRESLYDFSFQDKYFLFNAQFGREKDLSSDFYFQYYFISNLSKGDGFYSKNNFQYGLKLASGIYSTKTYKLELGVKILRGDTISFYDNRIYIKSSFFKISDNFRLSLDFEYLSVKGFQDETVTNSSLVWSF